MPTSIWMDAPRPTAPRKCLAVVVFALLAFLAFSGLAHAATLTVNVAGPGTGYVRKSDPPGFVCRDLLPDRALGRRECHPDRHPRTQLDLGGLDGRLHGRRLAMHGLDERGAIGHRDLQDRDERACHQERHG